MSRLSPRTVFIIRSIAGFGHPISKIAHATGTGIASVKRVLMEYGPISNTPHALHNAEYNPDTLHYWMGYLHNLTKDSILATPEKTSVILSKEALPLFQHFLETCLPIGKGEPTLWTSERPLNPNTVLAVTENEHLFLAMEHAKAYYGTSDRLGTFRPTPSCRESRHYWRGVLDACEAVRDLTTHPIKQGTAQGPSAGFAEGPRIVFETDNGLPFLNAFAEFASEELISAGATKNKLKIETLAKVKTDPRKRGPKQRKRQEDLQSLHERGRERDSLVGPAEQLVRLIEPPQGNWARTVIKGAPAAALIMRLYEQADLSVGQVKELLALAGVK